MTELFLDQQIKIMARRIKRIEESPDPDLLRSNKLMYELEKERAEHMKDAWQQGKHFASTRGYECLLRSMGFEWGNFAHMVDRNKRYPELKATLEKLGFPEKCCDRTVATLALVGLSELPKPDICLISSHGCDSHCLTMGTEARYHDVPTFFLDIPLDFEDKVGLNTLNYIADQLGEFIEWAEKKVPGIKYDEGRHREFLDIEAIGEKYLSEIYQLRKKVPCPIAPLDAFRIEVQPTRYPNMQKVLEYLRISRDELGERVASGKGPLSEERLRLLWAASGPYAQNFNPWRLFKERKVAMPLLMHGNAMKRFGAGSGTSHALRSEVLDDVGEYGVKLSPLQVEASDPDRTSWGGPGKRWITAIVDVARDLGAHGIVQFLQVGCTPVHGLGSMLAERAKKELNIPVLNVEGREMDKDYMTQGQFEQILSPFMDKCFSWAGKLQ